MSTKEIRLLRPPQTARRPVTTYDDGTEAEGRALTAFPRLTRAYTTVDRKERPTLTVYDLRSGQLGVLGPEGLETFVRPCKELG